MEFTEKFAGILIILAGLISSIFGFLIGLYNGGFVMLLFGGIIILLGLYFLFGLKSKTPSSKPKNNKFNVIVKNAVLENKISQSKDKTKVFKNISDIEKRKQDALKRIKAVHNRR